MTEDDFWELIETARKECDGDIAEMRDWLISELAMKTIAEIREYYLIFEQLRYKAYNRELWSACVFINCGCNELGFFDWLNCIIAHGKKVFYEAIENPDSLANIFTQENRYN
ncbi:MAG: DUF4240 domain-containing protein, partial [Chloroflexota bacterium]